MTVVDSSSKPARAGVPQAEALGIGLRCLRSLGAALQRIPRALCWLPAFLWVSLIWTLSSIGSISKGLGVGPITFFGNLAHAPEFGLLCLWILLLPRRVRGWVQLDRWTMGWVWGATVGYGILDELHQSTVPGRDASTYDVITDAVAAACVIWIVKYSGQSEASEAGLWKRLFACTLACVLTAAIATWVSAYLPI